MATLSATASTAASTYPTKAVHEGVNYAFGSYTVTASLSAGDVIHMVKVPMNARIMHVFLQVDGVPAASTVCLDVGDGGDTARYIDSATVAASTIVHATTGLGYKYSAGSSTAYDTVDVTVTEAGSATSSYTIKLGVSYIADEN